MPPSGLAPFKLTNFTINRTPSPPMISATLQDAGGTRECSMNNQEHEEMRNIMQLCRGSEYLGYPRNGHVIVMGLVDANG
jgi:hypothetical protein